MIQLETLLLPDGLIWLDEFDVQSVPQTTQRTLDGSLVVFYGQYSAGVPITLASEPDAGWLTRELVEGIAALAAMPGGIFPLLLRGQTHQVMFRHQDPPAFEAKPLVNRATPQPGDYYLATLKLMTI
jgi:hypothetical protein